jgi:hypothetical protein
MNSSLDSASDLFDCVWERNRVVPESSLGYLDSLDARARWAEIKAEQGRYDEAKAAIDAVVVVQRRLLGMQHSLTKSTVELCENVRKMRESAKQGADIPPPPPHTHTHTSHTVVVTVFRALFFATWHAVCLLLD